MRRIIVSLGMVFASLSVVLAGDSANWTITKETVPPNSPIVTGTEVIYTAEQIHNPGAPVNSYYWQYYPQNCSDKVFGFSRNGQSSTTGVMVIPGTFVIKCMVKYGPASGMPNPPADEIPTTTITIPIPDGFRIANGLVTPTPNISTVTMGYRIQCGGVDSERNSGLAQELITNRTQIIGGVVTHPPNDTQWTPAASEALFFLQGPMIYDLKGTRIPANIWNQIGVGDVFFKFTQSNRLMLHDNCGDYHAYSLGSKNLQRRKVSATEWQIEEQ